VLTASNKAVVLLGQLARGRQSFIHPGLRLGANRVCYIRFVAEITECFGGNLPTANHPAIYDGAGIICKPVLLFALAVIYAHDEKVLSIRARHHPFTLHISQITKITPAAIQIQARARRMFSAWAP
jgi:hypothetical protein